ncbi:MAG TPA: polyhydroxyalkanoate depolymerase, partial [Ottowia sp.]|nr:polyhydroxyalkanoate depolymerase [Ottowia sp.]
MLYNAYQLQSDLLSPMRLLAQGTSAATWWHNTERTLIRSLSAVSDVLARMRLTHTRPAYGIDQVEVAGRMVPVVEEQAFRTPFGTLLHFRKEGVADQPPVLLAAPLSGHFATLLRETVRTLLQDHDVYITDWHNARDVALRHGAFGLDDYVGHMIGFIDAVHQDSDGQPVHVVAVCQPCVAALAACAVMAEDGHEAQPRTLTLMAGPVDCRVNPTEVNRLAVEKPIEWFERHLISHVPLPHAGFMRRVYPGFVQLTAFMSMNLERHVKSFEDIYHHLFNGEVEKADAIRTFYEEYLAVNDLPAEFYLETVNKVFQTYDLPRGVLTYR